MKKQLGKVSFGIMKISLVSQLTFGITKMSQVSELWNYENKLCQIGIMKMSQFVRLLGTLAFFMRHVTNYTTIDHLTVEVKRKPLVNSRRVEQNKCVIFLLPHKYLIIVFLFEWLILITNSVFCASQIFLHYAISLHTGLKLHTLFIKSIFFPN